MPVVVPDLESVRELAEAVHAKKAPWQGEAFGWQAEYLPQRAERPLESRLSFTPAEFWMFYSADDAFLPPNLYFINGTDTAETVSRLHGAAQLNRTVEWLTPLTLTQRRMHTERVAVARSSTLPARHPWNRSFGK